MKPNCTYCVPVYYCCCMFYLVSWYIIGRLIKEYKDNRIRYIELCKKEEGIKIARICNDSISSTVFK
jgi:hypothetical protein